MQSVHPGILAGQSRVEISPMTEARLPEGIAAMKCGIPGDGQCGVTGASVMLLTPLLSMKTDFSNACDAITGTPSDTNYDEV